MLRDASHGTRANAVANVRKKIRGQFRDIRANTAVCKALWALIEVEKARASESLQYTAGPRRAGPTAHPDGAKGGKRKRRAAEDGSETEVDERADPVRTRSRAARED